MQYIWDFVGSNAKYFGKLFWKAKKMLKDMIGESKEMDVCFPLILSTANWIEMKIILSYKNQYD